MSAKHLVSVQAEQELLGAILSDSGCVELAMQLKGSDFGHPEHSEILLHIHKDIEAGRKPTPLSLGVAVGRMEIGKISGAVYIARLAHNAKPAHARDNLALIKSLAARRQLLVIADWVKSEALAMGSLPRETGLTAIQALDDAVATSRSRASQPQTVHEAAMAVIDGLDVDDDGDLISTGLKTLDDFMGGWPRRELSLIAGRPSMGKSAIMSAIARRGAKAGVNFMVFSLEMPSKALSARMLSDFVWSSQPGQSIPYKDIINKRVTPAQKERLRSAADVFRDYSIKIDDQRGLNVTEIQLRAMRHAEFLAKQGKRLDVIMIDHIGKIRPGDRYRGMMTHETGEKSDALMNMSYDLDVAVVAAHQLNRNTEGREDKHPTPADLRDSGNLEQDAHTLIFPYRQSYYLERMKMDDPEKERIRLATLEKKKNMLEILVSKCRNGSVGAVEVFADMASNHIRDLLHANRAAR